MDHLRGLLGIRRMDRVPNAQIRELWGVTGNMDERFDVGFSSASVMWRELRNTLVVT